MFKRLTRISLVCVIQKFFTSDRKAVKTYMWLGKKIKEDSKRRIRAHNCSTLIKKLKNRPLAECYR